MKYAMWSKMNLKMRTREQHCELRRNRNWDSVSHQAYVENASLNKEESDKVLSMLKVQLKIVLAKYLQVTKEICKCISGCM